MEASPNYRRLLAGKIPHFEYDPKQKKAVLTSFKPWRPQRHKDAQVPNQGLCQAAVRNYATLGFNRFGHTRLFGELLGWTPKVRLDRATAQRFRLLQQEDRFQVALQTIRIKHRLAEGWLVTPSKDGPRRGLCILDVYRERYLRPFCEEQVRPGAEREASPELFELRKWEVRFLNRIKQRMEWRFPEAEQLALHRACDIPVTDIWKELIEWYAHCGQAGFAAELNPFKGLRHDPHCQLRLWKNPKTGKW
jgi:hypothetical protein